MNDEQSTDDVDQEIPEDESAILWAWSQGWRGKANVIIIWLAVTIMAPLAKASNALRDVLTKIKAYPVGFCTAYRESRNMGEGRVASILVGFIILAEISVELNGEDE